MVDQVFSGAFEEALRWCACALMEAAYCGLDHARLCRVQQILPHRMCASMHDEEQLRVEHCIGFGSCGIAYRLADMGTLSGGNIVYSVWKEAAGY